MKALVSKYLGPTNFKGARVTATAEGFERVTLSYNHALTIDENHEAAFRSLLMGRPCEFAARINGTLPDGRCVSVFK